MLVMSLYIGYCNKLEVGDLEANEANFPEHPYCQVT
jgi:hypothetical protein